MSRVEPKDRSNQREAGRGHQLPGDRGDSHPGQAEGEERVVDEALRNQERAGRERARQ